MRCRRCQFENMPGESRCFRCGSVLDSAAGITDIYPPRMPPSHKYLRSLGHRLRIHSFLPDKLTGVKMPEFLKIISKGAFCGLIFSIIPGLAHLIDGRFREVRWFVLGWCAALPAGIFLYGSNTGLFLLGLAVGLHGWIAFQHLLLKEKEVAREKIETLIILLIVTGLAYWGIRRTVFNDFVFGYSILTVPFYDVQNGDLLLGRRSLARPENLNRGDFVLVRSGNFIVGRRNRQQARRGPLRAVQIVGVAGDTILIESRVFSVNEKTIDANQTPVPDWVRGRFGPIKVPRDKYFITDEYNVERRGNATLDLAIIENALLIDAGEIRGKAVMRWMPLNRRGYLGMTQQ